MPHVFEWYWMDACPVMETDGGRNRTNPLARLEIVYFGAIGASDNHTLYSRNVETPTDTFCAIWDGNFGALLSVPAMTFITRLFISPQTREGTVAGKGSR